VAAWTGKWGGSGSCTGGGGAGRDARERQEGRSPYVNSPASFLWFGAAIQKERNDLTSTILEVILRNVKETRVTATFEEEFYSRTKKNRKCQRELDFPILSRP